MSSPSDNEKSKHTDEESLSDKESFADEQEVAKKDRKKKRKSKDLLKSPSKVKHPKAGPGTSKKVDLNLMVGDSDSNSGEKRVGVVGDNIKQLNLNEGDKAKDSNQKGMKTTGVQAGVGPGISIVSQPDPIIESSIHRDSQIVQQPPANEQDLLIKESRHREKELRPMAIASSSMEEVHGEPVDSLDLKADMHQLPSTSVAYRRKAFSQKADDTLDDVSEIISDFPDIPSDSSLGQMPDSSGRLLSQETSSDGKAEGRSESLDKDCKVAARKSKDGHQSDKPSGRNKNIAYKDDGAEKNVEQKTGTEKQQGKCDDHASPSRKVVDPRGYKEQSNVQRKNEKDGNENDKPDSDNQNCEEQVSLQAGSKLVMKDYIAGAEVDQREEPMEEQDGSVHQDHSDNDANESYPAEPIEDPENVQNMDEESIEDDQLENEDNQESVEEQAYSSEQGGNASQQGSGSEYENFARGEYVGFPIDSTTSDSGIENSLAVFGGNLQVPDNSESNEGSALGSSAAAGFQNLQNWVEHGASLPQPNEEIPEASNITEKGGPSTSYAQVISRQIRKVAIFETIEDLPMECAEHFAGTQTEGSVLEDIPDAQIKYEEPIKDASEILTFDQRPDSPGRNFGEVQIENENLNIVSGARSSNEPNAELFQITSSEANVQESNPDYEIDAENNPLNSGETAANNNQISSMNPKTSQRLSKGDLDNLSSSSQDQSRESSLADMEDAIESSDSLSKEAEPEQTATNILQSLAATGIAQSKDSGSKPLRSKRRTKNSGEDNSPFKKQKDTISCGQQARAVIASLKRQKPDSDDESSKDDDKFKG